MAPRYWATGAARSCTTDVMTDGSKLVEVGTFLQQERWKAVQLAKLQGMSIRRMARELGIHRETVRRTFLLNFDSR